MSFTFSGTFIHFKFSLLLNLLNGIQKKPLYFHQIKLQLKTPKKHSTFKNNYIFTL